MTKQIIAIGILLLSLSTHISAQNRSAEENLAGLQAMGLVVKYGNADGLDIAEQPAILLILQERARKLLTQAEIPLLESADEAEMAGKPRLVFTVTANKNTDTAPAVHIESSIYERVRLWRDEKKEVELATWVWGGVGGPRVTQKMLLDVLDAQIKGFVKDYRAANPNRQPVESGNADQATPVKDNPNTLEGLTGTRLFVSIKPYVFEHPRTPELSKMLQSEAEKKFRQAGIPLHRYGSESEPAGRPLLYVFIILSQPNSGRAAIEIESKLWQRVRPVRDLRNDVEAVTWESNARDGGPISDEAVVEFMNSQLDEFIKAFNAANPNLTSQPNAKAQ